jgi:nitroreductase
MTLDLTLDELLSTTRSVRKRLDLTRPVARAVVLECLDLALQAPTGSNRQGWAWMFVEDADKKRAIADLYGVHFDEYATQPMPWEDGDLRHAQASLVRDSATYLREHFHEVPIMMIPLFRGRLDDVPVHTAAGAWGSVLPAVWSFMLALRSRGLGSAWTTLHLRSEREVADICGIPYDEYTQAGLFPIAYTIGTDFKPAKRLDATDLVHWNTW